MKPSRDGLFAIASAVAVCFGLIAGWSMMGSRSDQRDLEADRRRVSSLRSIASQIRNVYVRKEPVQAPASWEEFAGTLILDQTTDPESGRPYEYKRLSDTTFSLCATFSRPTEQAEVRYQSQFWIHPAGHHCFQFDLKQSWPW